MTTSLVSEDKAPTSPLSDGASYHTDLTNEQYHAAPGVSKSQLDLIARSPRHYWAKYLDPNRVTEEPTKAMVIGSATHAAILEPGLFSTRYVCAPDFGNPLTKAAKEAKADFQAANAGKIVLAAPEFDLCVALRTSVLRHPDASGLLSGGVAESSVFAVDPVTGLTVKCRPDYLKDSGIIVDLKTTDDASPIEFGRSAAKFRYHVQAAHYLDTFKLAFGEAPSHFVFVVVEKKPPYEVGVYYIEAAAMSVGRQLARRDLNKLAECQASDAWPGYTPDPQPLAFPEWALRI